MYATSLHLCGVHRTARYRCDQTIAFVGHTLPADATGHLYADPSLDEGLIMPEGVQTTSDGNVAPWLTNTTDASMSIEAGEAIALWEPDMDGEFELADSLNNEVVLMANALKTEHRRNKERMAAVRHADHGDPTAVPAARVRHRPTNGDAMMVEAPNTVVPSGNKTMNSASTDAYNAEDYQWKDDHLSLDLSRVPAQPRDPPVGAP